MKLVALCTSLLLAAAPVQAECSFKDEAGLASAAADEAHRSLPLLRELLSIPNDAHFPEQIAKNINWISGQFKRRGFSIQEIKTPGSPLLLASREIDPRLPAILVYLQADGQPVDESKWDQSSPFEPVLKVRDGAGWQQRSWPEAGEILETEARIFARSASDAKGPIAMLLAALDRLADCKRQPSFNLKIVLDFEEELGSPNLPQVVTDNPDRFAADLLLILDGPRHHTDRPTLFFGARGIARLTLTTFGPLFPQHSGTFGNYAPDPALGMSRLLTSMKDTLGRVTIPGFYEGVDLTEAERAVLAAVPDNEADILAHLGVKVPDRVATSYQEAMQYPSLTILGLQSGWTGAQTRTIVPATAVAELDIRLVPEIPAERLVALIKDHIRHQGFHLIAGQYPTPEERASHANLARLEYRVAYNAFRTPLASPAAAWARSALTRAFSEEPVQIRMMGGSIPIAPFVEALGIPAIGVPTVYLENNQHSPNENLRFGNYVEGIQTFMSLLSEPVTFR